MSVRLTLGCPVPELPGLLAEVSISGQEGRLQVARVCGPLQSRPVVNQTFLLSFRGAPWA